MVKRKGIFLLLMVFLLEFFVGVGLVFADFALLEWDQNSDADYYVVYWGPSPDNYIHESAPIDASRTNWMIDASEEGIHYYSIKAFNSCGNSSDFSDVVSYQVLFDSDNDGISDEWEQLYFGSSIYAYGDADGDGVSNLREYQLGTDPNDADTDGDGYTDGQELYAFSDPNNSSENPDQSIFIEAELGTINAPMSEEFVETASAGGFVQAPVGTLFSGSVNFTIDFDEDGDYYVWARTIAPDGNSDSVYIEIDETEHDFRIPQSTEWTWNRVTTGGSALSSLVVSLTGTVDININNREGGTQIDSLIITQNSDFVPNGADLDTAVTTVIDAEAGVITSPMIGVQGFDSFVYAPVDNLFSGSVSHKVALKYGGEYYVWVRAIAPDGSSDSSFIGINGTEHDFRFPANSSEWAWNRVTTGGSAMSPLVVSLDAGTVDINIRNREGGTLINKIVLTRSSVFDPSELDTVAEYAYIEPEKGVITSSMFKDGDKNAFGSRFVQAPAGTNFSGSVTVPINIDEDGDYYLWARTIAPDDNSDSVYIEVNGIEHDFRVPQSMSWQWNRITTGGSALSELILSLEAGITDLIINNREGGTLIDRLVIAKSASFMPAPTLHFSSFVVEAESFTLTAPTFLYEAAGEDEESYVYTSYGTIFDGFASRDVYIPEEGEYTIWVRAITPDDNSDSVFIGIDGTEYDFRIPQNSEWTWHRVTMNGSAMDELRLLLPEGLVHFEINNREGGTLIDKIFVTRSSDLEPED